MGHRLGLDAKLYIGETELTNVKDVTLNLESGEADVTTRANSGWRATVPTLKDASIEFEMIWDPEDAGFAAIKTAYFANEPLAGVKVLDGESGQGLQADCAVTKFSRNEPLEEAIGVSVSLKPTYAANAPEWMTVEAAP